ncbi:MAG: hypothetical protein IR160_04215 [Salinibacterium sp.]|nr:HIRAN domain-containing protein [Salinibacterium sp.]MBF0671772.1 hypothetical protein [Salinibacterium sp.]
MAGFLSRLFGGKESVTGRAVTQPAPAGASHPREVPVSFREDLEVSGESYYRAGIGKIFRGLGRVEGGVTMQTAHLVPDPKNQYDRNAVRVLVLGEQVGHVPQESSFAIARLCNGVGRGNVASVSARIWARSDGGTWRSRVTLMFSGDREDEKDYAADRREIEAAAAARDAEKARKRTEKAEREAQREARRLAGAVDGQYWPLLKPSISELKRQQRFDEAREMLGKCIDAAEREAAVTKDVPDSWPTEHMSVVLRRLKQYPLELAVLERYVSACGTNAVPESVQTRLSRSRLTAERTAAKE